MTPDSGPIAGEPGHDRRSQLRRRGNGRVRLQFRDLSRRRVRQPTDRARPPAPTAGRRDRHHPTGGTSASSAADQYAYADTRVTTVSPSSGPSRRRARSPSPARISSPASRKFAQAPRLRLTSRRHRADGGYPARRRWKGRRHGELTRRDERDVVNGPLHLYLPQAGTVFLVEENRPGQGQLLQLSPGGAQV